MTAAFPQSGCGQVLFSCFSYWSYGDVWVDSFYLALKHLISPESGLRKLNLSWMSKWRHPVISVHVSIAFAHIKSDKMMPFHPYSSNCFPLYLRDELSAFSWLHMHASTCAELICPCCLHAQSINGYFSLHFQSRMCHYCCSHWKQRIHLYVPLLLEPFCSRHLGWNSLSLCHKAAAPQIGPIAASAAAATNCQRALTRCRCGNGRNNELLQGYLCISPCHDCESGSANLIRWDTLLKMFSDFLHLLILCPQIDFRSGCWEEMISAFRSCREFRILQIFESWFSKIHTSHL